MYFILLVVSCISIDFFPKSGPSEGGTIITLTDFDYIPISNISCVFNNISVSITYFNISHIECISPPGYSTVNLNISGLSIENAGNFTYYNLIKVNSITPLSGSEFAYQNLSINVSSVLSADTWAIQIWNYSIPCTGNIFCIIPPLAVLNNLNNTIDNIFPIFLSRNNQNYQDTGFTYEYLLAEIYDLEYFQASSYHGPTNGGTEVNISLYVNISMSNPSCKFGNIIVYAYSITNSSFSCKSPGGTGKVQLTISANGIDYCNIGQEFIYDSITIKSYYPSQGTLNGNSYILVYGIFTPYLSISCKFNNTVTSGFIFLNKYFNCTTPSHSQATVNFSISLNNQDYYYIGPYTFRNVEKLVSLLPSVGPTSGGTQVTVNMSYINSTNNAYCLIGPKYKTKLLPGNICLMPPSSLVISIVTISVSSNDIDYESFITYKYYTQITLNYISPQFIPNTFMQRNYTISGAGFSNTGLITVNLIGNYYNANFSSSSLIYFIVADQLPVGKLNVSVSLNNQNYSPSQVYLDVYTEPNITSVNPNFGFLKGGITLAIRGFNFIYSETIFCSFNSTLVVGIYVSNELVTCINPTQTVAGIAKVAISFNNGYNYSNMLNFTYIATPKLPTLSITQSYNQQRLNMALSYTTPFPPLYIKAGSWTKIITAASPYVFIMPANPSGSIVFNLQLLRNTNRIIIYF